MNRRNFLKFAGSLLGSFAIAPKVEVAQVEGIEQDEPIYPVLDEDNLVVVYSFIDYGHCYDNVVNYGNAGSDRYFYYEGQIKYGPYPTKTH